MQIKLHLSRTTRKEVSAGLRQAYRRGQVRVIRRIQVLWHLAAGQTVRDYLAAFLLRGCDSFGFRRSPGRPAKLSQTQRQDLAAGYPTGCWSAVLIGDWLERHFGVTYHPHYLCQVLDNLGFSFQKARFVSDHLNEAARVAWKAETWPRILRRARQTGALILFGDEVRFAQWGSLSSTWAPKGQQPTVPTSGKRTGDKVFGLIDSFSGRLFWTGLTGRFNAGSYQSFLEAVLAQTQPPIILIQDGARYHTGQALQQFFTEQLKRLTVFQLPGYSPDFNPIEYLWKKVKKQATHLQYFPEFAGLMAKVDAALLHFAQTPSEITALMGCSCASLGELAA